MNTMKGNTAYAAYLDLQQEAMKSNPIVKDDENAANIFSLTSNALLAMIANGEIDCKQLAKYTLENRGYDANGKYVGFGK